MARIREAKAKPSKPSYPGTLWPMAVAITRHSLFLSLRTSASVSRFYTGEQSTTHRADAKPDDWFGDLAPGASFYALEELASGRTKCLELLRGVPMFQFQGLLNLFRDLFFGF